MNEREERNKAFRANFTLRAKVCKERRNRIREALSFKKTHNVATPASTAIVLNLLLLYLVKKIERLVVEASIGASKISALKQADLARFCFSILV